MIRISRFTLIVAGTMLAAAPLAPTLAHAGGIAVQVSGRDPAAVRQDVLRAARTVCVEASAHDQVDEFGPIDECVDATVRVTLAELAGNAAPAFDVASINPMVSH